MTKLIAITMAVAAMLMPHDGTFARFVDKLEANAVTFDYSYVLQPSKGASIKGSGDVRLNGACYRVCGDGLEIISDGHDIWTLDREAGEAVVEESSSSEILAGANPAMLLANASSLFEQKSCASINLPNGRKAVRIELQPRSKNGGISKMTAVLSEADFTLISADIVQEDGSVLKISISHFIYMSKSMDTATYKISSSDFDRRWVVTDLR